MRIVLDTAIFVTAIRSRQGASAAVIRLILQQQLVPLMDLKLALEYRDVALRPEHLKPSNRSPANVMQLIEAIEAVAEPVKIVRKPRPLSPDPNDDMVIDIAINGSADAIVTANTKHFAQPCKRFAILVLSPAELLETLMLGDKHAR